MGTTRNIVGDNHIVFHVGKELPNNGDDFLLVPGGQSAQGRGVYCSNRPDLSYSGGESYQENPKRIPIYCIPMHGKWRIKRTKNKKGLSVMHTEGRIILFRDIRHVDSLIEGNPVRIYFSTKISFYSEPNPRKSITTASPSREENELSRKIRTGAISTDEAIRILNATGTRDDVNSETVRKELLLSINEAQLPENLEMRHILSASEAIETPHTVEGKMRVQ